MDLLLTIKWRPGIGDPTFMGWFTVAAYALAAFLAWRAWQKPAAGKRNKLWLGVAILMALLCLNKQLDLQSLFTDIGRMIARDGNWYNDRRRFQKWFVYAVIAGAGLFACGFALRNRAFVVSHKLLSAGILFLLTFIVVRAISFHHVDSFLKTRIAGMKWNWILELTGIFLIAAAAACEGKGRRSLGSR